MSLARAGVELYAKDKATRQLNKFNKTLGMTKGALRSVAAAAGVGLGLYGIARFVQSSVKEFADFEQELANVSTMLDDQTMSYMPQYKTELSSLALKYGEATTSLSKGLYDILSASIPAADAMGVLDVSTKAAKAGLTTTAIAADAITTILNSYGFAAKDAGKVSDVLFAIVKRGKITFEELASSIGKVAALGASAGLSFEEVGAAVATMTRSGIQSDRAMTALKGIIVAFMKPAKEAAILAKDKFGLAMNTATLQTEGLTGALSRLKGATAEEMAIIFPNIRALLGQAALRKNIIALIQDHTLMLNSLGMTEKAFQKQAGITKFALLRAAEAWKTWKKALGAALSPTIIKLANGFVKWTQDSLPKIKDWAKVISDEALKARDSLMSFVDFVKSNGWRAGLKLGLAITKEHFITFGKVLVVIMKEAAAAAADAFIQTFGESLGRWLIETGKPKGVLGIISSSVPAVALTRRKMMKAGVNLVKESRKPPAIRPSLSNQVKAELQAGQDKIAILKKEAGIKEAIDKEAKAKAKAKKEEESLNQKVAADKIQSVREVAKEDAAASAFSLADVKDHIAQVRSMDELTTREKIRNLQRYKEEHQTALGVMAEAESVLTKEIESYQKARVGGYAEYLAEIREDLQNWSTYASDKYGEVAKSAESSLASAFMNMTAEGMKWKDAMKGFFIDVLKSFQSMLADMAAKQLMGAMLTGEDGKKGILGSIIGAAIGGIGGLLGGGATATTDIATTDTATTDTSNYNAAGVPSTYVPNSNPYKHSGGIAGGRDFKPNEVPIIAEKGEIFIPEGTKVGGTGNVTVNVINQSSAKLQSQTVRDYQKDDQHILNVIVSDYNSGGAMMNLIDKK